MSRNSKRKHQPYLATVVQGFKYEMASDLRKLMDAKGVSIRWVARRSGRSVVCVNNLLKGRGNPRLETIADVYLALDVAAHLELRRPPPVLIEGPRP